MLPAPAGKEPMEILVTPPNEDTPLVATHDGATATTGEQELKDERRHSSDSSRASRSLPTASGNTGYVAARPGVHLDMHAPMEVSTSVVLSFCQQNVLRHYFRLLAMVGWRPLVDTSEHVRCQPALQTLNVMHNVVVFVVLVLGHVLQYTACFRRDSIVSERSQAFNSAVTHEGSAHGKDTTCGSSSFAVYVLPAIMQVAAYAVALVHTRSHENEQFQSLVEKVFLQLTPADVWNVAKKRITRRLHAVYAAGILWITASLASQMLNIYAGGTLRLEWMYVAADDQDLHYYLLAALVVMLLFRDIVSMTIATSYAIHCQLLLVYLQNMSQAVRERRMTFLEFYRGVEEARKGVHYLNQRQALAVTVQTIWVTSRTVVCFYALLGTPWTHWIRFVAAWLNVFVWLSLVLIPLVQASRLSSTCRHVRELGLELTARPFVYRDLPQSELDSFLLFTTSLRMHAKLCALPITKRTVIFVFLFIGASLFIAVQLDIVRFRP